MPFSFERRDPGPNDVQIEILYCGVCHSELHTARNEWTNTAYPVVPGHEIVGRVSKVGSKVKKSKEGDLAGVGCLVGSCGLVPVAKPDSRITARTSWFSPITAKTGFSAE
jgi:uncharacterized zinc-type alcohol dehydrogenase-like protein